MENIMINTNRTLLSLSLSLIVFTAHNSSLSSDAPSDNSASAASTYHQLDVPSLPKKHTCPLCSISFTRKNSLILHMQNVHPDAKINVCPLCHTGFKQKANLAIHIRQKHRLVNFSR